MIKTRRILAINSGQIEAPAQAVWDALLDWQGILKWWEPSGEARWDIRRVDLHGAPDQVPRTRIVQVGPDKTCIEELFLVSESAHRIYYDMQPNGVPGIHNYVATTFVDEIDESRCVIGFNSNFDVFEEEFDAAELKKHVEQVYDRIMDGISKTICGKPATR